MKKILGLLSLLVASSFGQTPEGPSVITLSTPAPSGVTNVFVSTTGVTGQTNHCYWVVAVFQSGMVASQASNCVANSNATLSGSNYNTVSWPLVSGATGYWVIRLSTPVFPGTGTVAVNSSVLSATTTSQTDQSNTKNAFTFTPASYANAHIRLDTTGYTQARLLIDTPINSVKFANLPSAASSTGLTYLVTDAVSASSCAAGGGTVTPAQCWSNGIVWTAIGGGGGGGTPGGSDGQVQYNNSGAFGGISSGYTNLASGATQYQNPDQCMVYTSTVTTDFGGTAATSLQFRLFTAPALWSFRSARIVESTTITTSGTTGGAAVTALAASIGSSTSPYGYVSAFPVMAASSPQFVESVGGVSLAATATSTQDVYLQLINTSVTPSGFLSNITGGVLKVNVCGVTLR
jgi:hypothetical protein